jgi:hypothetical protein
MSTNKCQWIGNSPKLTPACNCDAVPNKSYCENHVWLVYKEGSHLRTRKKDIRVANAVWDLENEFAEAVAELELEGFL